MAAREPRQARVFRVFLRDRLSLTESQRRLLDERIDEHEANPDDVEPWDDVRDDILRKL